MWWSFVEKSETTVRGSKTCHSTKKFRRINFPKYVISISAWKCSSIDCFFNWEMSTGRFSGISPWFCCGTGKRYFRVNFPGSSRIFKFTLFLMELFKARSVQFGALPAASEQLFTKPRLSGSFFHPQPPSLPIILPEPGSEREVLTKETWFSLLREWKSWKLQWEQFLARPGSALVRISIRDLVADGKSLVRNSGVVGGGENLILIKMAREKGERRIPRNCRCVAGRRAFWNKESWIAVAVVAGPKVVKSVSWLLLAPKPLHTENYFWGEFICVM